MWRSHTPRSGQKPLSSRDSPGQLGPLGDARRLSLCVGCGGASVAWVSPQAGHGGPPYLGLPRSQVSPPPLSACARLLLTGSQGQVGRPPRRSGPCTAPSPSPRCAACLLPAAPLLTGAPLSTSPPVPSPLSRPRGRQEAPAGQGSRSASGQCLAHSRRHLSLPNGLVACSYLSRWRETGDLGGVFASENLRLSARPPVYVVNQASPCVRVTSRLRALLLEWKRLQNSESCSEPPGAVR